MKTTTIKLTDDQARALVGKNEALYVILKANFTKEQLSVNIMDRLNSFQDALDLTGETLEEFNKRTQYDDDQEKAGKELSVLFKAIREGNEDGRYYPYFYNPNRSGSGSGFSYGGYGYVFDRSGVGSRHTADTADKATFLGKNFTSIFQRYING